MSDDFLQSVSLINTFICTNIDLFYIFMAYNLQKKIKFTIAKNLKKHIPGRNWEKTENKKENQKYYK